MNAVEGYLNRMSWAMGGSLAEQQAARDEIRSHIMDQARDLQVQGMREREAIASALRDLGDPEEVGRALRRSRGSRPLRRPLVQPEGALLFARPSHRHLPQPHIALAVTALVAMLSVVALLYLWP